MGPMNTAQPFIESQIDLMTRPITFCLVNCLLESRDNSDFAIRFLHITYLQLK